MIRIKIVFFIAILAVSFNNYAVSGENIDTASKSGDGDIPYVQISPRDPRYFELSDGAPYIPNGLNMVYTWGNTEQAALNRMESWLEKLEDNNGNLVRVWLSHDFWDVEHDSSGVYDEVKAGLVDSLFAMSRRHNLRLKLTFEHFRQFDNDGWDGKPLHLISNGGTAESVTDFFTGEASREQFKGKLDWFAGRYGNDPVVFAWELWNEMNAVSGSGWIEWTELMLPELKQRFPYNLVTQSLGSHDSADDRYNYRKFTLMPDNDIAQVHRYLDLGAPNSVCHGPVDILAADAVKSLLSYDPQKPVLLAESGAVEPNHAGPFNYYQRDAHGIILHDVLFAPFFAGSAGSGQIWHWDKYVAPLNLWWQFGRFDEAVRGLDPPAEAFEAIEPAHTRLRVYALKGANTFIAWCRDSENTWQSELEDRIEPGVVSGATLDLETVAGALNSPMVYFYDPWENEWTQRPMNGSTIEFPDFKRSIVAKFAYDDTVYTSVETIPSSFSVSTPYPNPFNPVTTIEYSLPHETQVKLEIFSVTGQKVAQLEDRIIQSGSHAVDWDASGMPSGIYLYKFTAGEFAWRDKMLLLK